VTEGPYNGPMSSTNVRPLAYSVPEAAEVAGVSRAHLYRAMQVGDLASVKTGSRRVVLHDDLVASLHGQREIADGGGRCRNARPTDPLHATPDAAHPPPKRRGTGHAPARRLTPMCGLAICRTGQHDRQVPAGGRESRCCG
jgi:excisionase family DNA binding protein